MHLLDVNMLIALIDGQHVHHPQARSWFRAHYSQGWATCPLTENGFLRIVGRPAYTSAAGGTLARAQAALKAFCRGPGHQFWPDDVSLRAEPWAARIRSPQDVTDLYLLHLAMRHDAILATLDTRIDPDVIAGSRRDLVVVV